MKILIINRHLQDIIGGSEVQCDLIARYLTQYGHDVVYGVLRPLRSDYGTPYRSIPVGAPAILSFWRLLRQAAPDVVYWRYNKKLLLPAALLCRALGCKLVFAISHVNDITQWSYKRSNPGSEMKQLILGGLNHFGFFFVDGVVSLRRDFLLSIPFEKKSKMKKVLIYNSRDPDKPGEFNWPKPYVVWIASVKKSKNPHLYIEAAARLAALPIDFLMVGKIQDRDYSYVESGHGMPPNVHYLGERKPAEAATILGSSLFLIHTCDPEGFCNVFIEAWQLGKPTVSLFFDPDGFIESRGIGCLSSSFEGFCDDIAKLVASPNLREEMGERARQSAAELFLPEVNMRRYDRFLSGVMNG